MPLDERLRETFQRASSAIEPDVELRLDATLRQGVRPRRETGFAGVLAAAAAVVVLVVVVRLAGGVLPQPGAPTSPLSSTLNPNEAIAGRYTVTLLASDAGVTTGDLGLAGTWSMTLLPNGELGLAAPAEFEGSRAEGHTFSLDGSTFRTDLYFNDYCSSLGTYRWILSDGELRLDVEAEDCAMRETLLSTRPWGRSE